MLPLASFEKANSYARQLLVDGLKLALGFSTVVLGTLYGNVWLWFSDYPPEIQAMIAVPPRPPLWQQLSAALLLFGTLGVLSVRATSRFLRAAGEALSRPFTAALVYAFLLFQFVNLWDIVVLDWLIFTWLTPEFIVLPGTEGSPGYDNYWFHFQRSFLHPGPWGGALVFSTVTALIAVRLHTWRGTTGA